MRTYRPRCFFLALFALTLASSSLAFAQIVPLPPPPPAPNPGLVAVHPPEAGADWTAGNSGCGGSCTRGPARLTPAVLEGCEGIPVAVNFRTDTHEKNPTLLSDRGDRIENQGGEIDWGDGQKTMLDAALCCSWPATHTYAQARQYVASATFAQQYTNANNPEGGCSYRCRVSQVAQVTIYLNTAAVCTGGKLKAKKKALTKSTTTTTP